jgi:diaminopimelate decarboxylase
MQKISPDNVNGDEKQYDLYGPLCTSIDVLGRAVKFRELSIDDIIGVHCSGAYGISASPVNFISHDPPEEIIVENSSGEISVENITRKQR